MPGLTIILGDMESTTQNKFAKNKKKKMDPKMKAAMRKRFFTGISGKKEKSENAGK